MLYLLFPILFSVSSLRNCMIFTIFYHFEHFMGPKKQFLGPKWIFFLSEIFQEDTRDSISVILIHFYSFFCVKSKKLYNFVSAWRFFFIFRPKKCSFWVLNETLLEWNFSGIYQRLKVCYIYGFQSYFQLQVWEIAWFLQFSIILSVFWAQKSSFWALNEFFF